MADDVKIPPLPKPEGTSDIYDFTAYQMDMRYLQGYNAGRNAPRVLGAGLDPWPNSGDPVIADAVRAPDDERAALLELWSTHIDASVRAELMGALVRYLDALPDESNREWAPKGRPSVDLPGSS